MNTIANKKSKTRQPQQDDDWVFRGSRCPHSLQDACRSLKNNPSNRPHQLNNKNPKQPTTGLYFRLFTVTSEEPQAEQRINDYFPQHFLYF